MGRQSKSRLGGVGAAAAALVAGAALLWSPGAAVAAQPLIYVASADSGPVTAYPAAASGAVHPVRKVKNPENSKTVWDPWGVTFDSSGALYVQSFLSDATTFVFAPGAADPT